MAIGHDLEKKLRGKFSPSAMVEMKFRGNDISFQTDEAGNPIVLFIGKRTSGGSIKGERYRRTLKKSDDGRVIKDHWDLKGKAS